MKFIDEEHKKFVLARYEELQKYQKLDVYYKSIIYILGMCPTTREHFDSIFNMKEGEIFIEALQASWQTGTSVKVTRVAFSLWNECNYDSLDDYEKNKISKNYNISELFCCGYAPYFWEGIKIRYPEYTEYEQNIGKSIIYTKVGKMQNLDYYIEKDIKDRLESKVIGEYIRVCNSNNKEIMYSIKEQQHRIDEYCNKNNIMNRVRYVDIGKSAFDKNRNAFNKMIEDIKSEKINGIIVTDISKLFRNVTEIVEFLSKQYMKDIDIISLNHQRESIKKSVNMEKTEDIEEYEELMEE